MQPCITNRETENMYPTTSWTCQETAWVDIDQRILYQMCYKKNKLDYKDKGLKGKWKPELFQRKWDVHNKKTFTGAA